LAVPYTNRNHPQDAAWEKKNQLQFCLVSSGSLFKKAFILKKLNFELVVELPDKQLAK